MIQTPFKNLIPELTFEEQKQLEENILSEGIREPLLLWNEILIDGHNRYAISQKHNLEYKTIQKLFKDELDAKIWIIKNQFGRRNLSFFQRAILALKLKEVFAIKAKENQVISGEQYGKGCHNCDNPIQPIDTKKELASIAGVSHNTIARVQKIQEKATPEIIASLNHGDTTINKVFENIKKDEKREQVINELHSLSESLNDDEKLRFESICDIRNCDLKDLLTSSNPDIIITDPPYPKEYIPLYEELAMYAKHVPLVAVMCGQSYLPEIISIMSRHLKYRWMLCYLTPGGQAVQQWVAKVNTFWKPILLFGESIEWFGDVAKSNINDNDKRFHNWGQSESGMMDLINRLSKPGDLICDPFLGAGTTGVAAIALKRKFIGCDIDNVNVIKSIERCRAQFVK